MQNRSDCGTLTVASLAFPVLLGLIGAATCAFSGSVGAAILSHEYKGYDPIEAAQMGAIGGAVIYFSLGVMLSPCLLKTLATSRNESDSERGNKGDGRTLAGYVVGQVVMGVIGSAIMNAGSHATSMRLPQSAAAFAVGGAVTACPATCALACILLPCATAYVACLTQDNPTRDIEMGVTSTIEPTTTPITEVGNPSRLAITM